MLLIYIMAQSNNGRLNATYKLPNNRNNANSNVSVLSWTTAPRTVQDISSNGAQRGPSYQEYKNPVNSNSNYSLYNSDELDPLPDNLIPTTNSYINTGGTFADRPTNAPYYLFFGKFASQGVSNLQPKFVGHKDEQNVILDQQPSNIYNIPDFPKDYTLYKSENTNINGIGDSQEMPFNLSTAEKLVYDGSSCPVNWRVFEPIRNKVLDISENGVIGGGGGGGSLNTGLYNISNNGSFIFVQNPSKRDISGIYFDTNNFDVSFNPSTNPNAYVSLKGGSGTDISFNNYFFKQPEMPVDCSFNFFPGSAANGTNDMLRIHWDKPFHRKTGSSYLQTGHRYFYKSLNPVENWLPQFTELVFDISGGSLNRRFCKDIFGNFVHEYEVGQGNGGVLDNQNQPQKYKAYAFLSANNTAVKLEATTNPQLNSIRTQYGSNAGYGNMETTIIDHFRPENTSGNYAGGMPRINDVVLGGNYDIAIYYRNNTKINTDPSLSPNDLYYNKHNVCVLKNIIFGRPGFPEPPTGMDIWNNSVTERYYLGGEGPSTKDSQNVSPQGMGLNLPWTNTSIIKVGYDCSLNMTYNSGSATTHRVQVGGANSQSNNLVFNNFPILYNLNASYFPVNMPDTKRFWPVGGNAPNSGVPPALQDYIKMIDIAAGGNGRDHPEFKYEITKYNVINDTKDDTLNPPDIRKVPFSPLPITRVIPIMSRSSCNLTNDVDYENVLFPVSADPTNTSTTNFTMKKLEYLNNNLVSQVNANAQRSRSRNVPTGYTTSIQYIDTIFLTPPTTVGGQTTKEILCVTSDSNVFKQLANFGEPKTGTITGQTYGDLIEPDAYLGSSMTSAPFISKVELDFQTDINTSQSPVTWGPGAFQTSTIPNTAELVGWDTNFTLANASNVSQTISHNLGAHNFTFSVSPTFDIADADPEITFSNKRGYYLGFDISNVMVEMDMHFVPPGGQGANPYKDSALLTPSYRQHRVILTHEVAKRGGASSSTSKQFIFRLATKPDDITVSNIDLTNFDSGPTPVTNGVLFTDFFGIKRLPPDDSQNTQNNNNGQFGGSGLELRVEFDLNNISENWLPHTSDTDSNDNLAYVEYVVGPGRYPSVNPSGDLITLKRDRIGWGRVMGTANTPSQGTTYSVRSFLEIHEGVTSLSVDSGNSSYLYSRKATDIGDPLFGLKNHKFYYSNNVTRNNINIEGVFSTAQNDGFTTLQECEDFSRFLSQAQQPNAPRKELFWDYTFPIHSVNQIEQKLPISIDDRLKLLHIYTYTTGSSVGQSHQTGTANNAFPWGGPASVTNGGFDLIDLEALLQNPSGSGSLSGFNTWYKHDKELPAEQSMWCNGSFVGPISNLSTIKNPYIDYTGYYNTTGHGDYSIKDALGTNIPNTGVTMNISSANYPSAVGAPSNGVQLASRKLKWLLFEVTDLPVDSNGVIRSFQVKLERPVGSPGGQNLIITVDYHMFYCERDPIGATTTSYTVNIGPGSTNLIPPPYSSTLLPLSWTTWLNCSVARGNTTASTIRHINYANNTGGSGNGCNKRVSGQQTMHAPYCETFGTTTGMRKFILIGLFEDALCSKITII